MEGYLGVDVGSISAKGAIIDHKGEVVATCYTRTQGRPIEGIKDVLRQLKKELPSQMTIVGVGTTGSARALAGIMIGADVVKNEIIAHAIAACKLHPDAGTIIEIGGQDSKIILIRDGIPVDFAMNTVCAAGTGSFLDHQATRIGVPVEQFGALALRAKGGVHIASRCTVFAESDMIHKAQLGIDRAEIIAGLCESIARNYLSTVAKGKSIRPTVLFQGGVAANEGVKRAFEKALNTKMYVPQHFLVMGAIGAALLASKSKTGQTKFVGFSDCIEPRFESRGFECQGCQNNCEIVEAVRDGAVVARSGSRCGKW